MKPLALLFSRRFIACGLSLEKLIALAGENEIPLFQLHRAAPKEVSGIIGEKDLPKLMALADTRGWEVKLGSFCYLAAAREWLKKRWGLALGAALMLALIIGSLQFVWKIEILDAGVYESDIRSYLLEKGIKPGIFKSSVSPLQLKNDLEWRFPSVAWVQVSYRGTALMIRLVEGVPVPEVETQGEAADIVASRGGIVVSVQPRAGTPMVKAGDIVQKGQILIKGEERAGTQGEMKPVKARGVVWCRVWESARVRVPAYEILSEETGRREVNQLIACPFMEVGDREETRFLTYDTMVETVPLGGLWLPVWVRRETRIEVALETRMRDEANVKAEAGLAALRALREKIGAGGELVDKWVDYCMIEDKDMEATATGELLLDIAMQGQAGSDAPYP